jgi:dipeptidyl-peptidase-4
MLPSPLVAGLTGVLVFATLLPAQTMTAQSSAGQLPATQLTATQLTATQAAAAEVFIPRFDPVIKEIEGWQVCIDPALLGGENQEAGAKALSMLANHLQRISIVVPAGPLAALRKVGLWIEYCHPSLKTMQYHPSERWLRANQHDPRLAKKVHIPQAPDIFSRKQMLKHPAVILHELAHAYHDQVLGFEYPEVLHAFERARNASLYQRVLLHTGEIGRHYGLTNHKEYFAEGTEAFLYRNDFYPFVRAELKEYDPDFHEVLEKIWGPAR